MRNSTQTWGLSTDPDVLLTVPKNSFQTIPERYNQPPVSLILPEVYYALSRLSNAFDKSRRTTKAIFLRGLEIERKLWKYDKPNSEHRCNAKEMDTTQWCLGQKKKKRSKHVWYMLYPFSRRNTLRTVTEKSWSHQPEAEALILNIIWECMIEIANRRRFLCTH